MSLPLAPKGAVSLLLLLLGLLLLLLGLLLPSPLSCQRLLPVLNCRPDCWLVAVFESW
jgi:hypothetical protein